MILRRLSSSLRKQDWGTVLVEIVIVVVGVFIGIQVSNWNDTRIQKSQEKAFLVQLRGEIAQNNVVSKYQQLYTDASITSGRRALAYLQSDKDCLSDCENLLIDFFHASQVWGNSLEDAVYREAQRHGFPSNPVTLEKVQTYFTGVYGWDLVNSVAPPFRERVRGYFSPDAAAALWQGCFRIADGRIEEMIRDCIDDLRALDTTTMLRNIRADEALVTQLQFWIGQNIFANGYSFDVQVSADVAIAAITEELGEVE